MWCLSQPPKKVELQDGDAATRKFSLCICVDSVAGFKLLSQCRAARCTALVSHLSTSCHPPTCSLWPHTCTAAMCSLLSWLGVSTRAMEACTMVDCLGGPPGKAWRSRLRSCAGGGNGCGQEAGEASG